MKTSITRQQFEVMHQLGENRIGAMGITREVFQKIIIEAGGDYQDDLQELMQKRVDRYRLATQPHLLERKPFNVKRFVGKDWEVIDEPGLPKRKDTILDASNIVRKDYLEKGETLLNGEERLRRIKASKDFQLDAEDFLALWEEKGHATLNWLHETQGITRLSFWGTILRLSHGCRYVLCLSRHEVGSWDWHYFWLDFGWCAGNPSGLLAS